jgi:hypothetical protein
MYSDKQLLHSKILLECSKETCLFSMSLEPTMTKFTSCINPFEADCLSCSSRSLLQQSFSQCHHTFLDAGATSLNHNVVIGDISITDESSKRSDTLLGSIKLCRTIGLSLLAKTDTVDFMVDGRTVHVTVVTCTRDGPHDVGWMPGSNTCDLTETLVRLARQFLSTYYQNDGRKEILPQRAVTPSIPLPLVTAMTSIISS